jgi:hypothetical protein
MVSVERPDLSSKKGQRELRKLYGFVAPPPEQKRDMHGAAIATPNQIRGGMDPHLGVPQTSRPATQAEIITAMSLDVTQPTPLPGESPEAFFLRRERHGGVDQEKRQGA